jgi:hypothetical protein
MKSMEDYSFRGLLFTILRKNRVRVTYRYGDATVPLDIEDSCVKLTAIDILILVLEWIYYH